MFENKVLVFALIALVIVSLKMTYKMTYQVATKLGYAGSQEQYGSGFDIDQPGFLIHLLVFAGIIMVLQKYNYM